MTRTRTVPLAGLLLATAVLLTWTALAGARTPIPGILPPDDEAPRVQIISLDRSPWSTDPAGEGNWGPVWGESGPVGEADMAATLAELELHDGTIIRLYATADNLIDGAFLRPGQGWIRFVHLFRGGDVGPNYAGGATLTAYEDILGRDGFLLRTDGYYQGTYDHWYYWFDEAGALQVLRANMDPVPLDLDGDGTEELAFNFDQLRGAFSFYYRLGDAHYRVTAEEAFSGELTGIESGAPLRLRFTLREPGNERPLYKTVSFTGGSLRVETGGDWSQPPPPAESPRLPPLPQPAGEARPRISIAAPDGWEMDGSGGELYDQLWYWLDGGGSGPVLRPAQGLPDPATAYTVTFTPPSGGAPFTWTLDANGLCRFSALEGTYRLERTAFGSPPAACHDLLAIYCQASRTSRDYDAAGRHLGRSLAWDIAAGKNAANS